LQICTFSAADRLSNWAGQFAFTACADLALFAGFITTSAVYAVGLGIDTTTSALDQTFLAR
jgi:hypothetical protein